MITIPLAVDTPMIWWILSAALHALPPPSETMPNPYYVFFYKFFQILGANFGEVNKTSPK